MKKLKNRITLLNIISNLFLQFISIISWFIIPKIILSNFGSEVNGLVSSITQFLSYISLVDGGISGVVVASLYKPLIDNDNKKISSIISTAESFYKKICFAFIIYTIILSIVYPIIFKVNFSYLYVASLVLVLSISMIVQYLYAFTLRNLLTADKKGFVVSLTQSLILILTIVFSYISVKIYPSIHILKFISGILFIFQPIAYYLYIKKHYNINKREKKDNRLLRQRWNGFAINIASFIHNSVDISLLTIFTNMATVSIYGVYSIVTKGLKSIVNAISGAINPTIGKAYASKNFNNLNKKMDVYEYLILLIVFFMFTLASLLITPFVMIYTKNIADANYNQPLFGILLVISEALYLIKYPHLNLAYSANKFKELTVPAFLEAIINIVVSLILINKYGLIGVAAGTICGMLYRLIYHVYFTKKLIDRHQLIFYKKIFIFICATVFGLVICYLFIPITKFNIKSLVISSLEYSLLFGTIYFITSVIFFKNELLFFKKYIFRKKIK